MRPLTASKLQMVKECAASHALPWVADEGTSYSQRGTGIHAAIERIPDVGLDAAVADLPDEWQRVARALAETPSIAPFLAPGGAALEAAMEWHPDTDAARHLGRGRESYKNAAAGSITGTADILAVTRDRVVVGDIKTGALAVTHPSKNLQLRFLALAACRAFNMDQATVFLAYARDEEDACIVSADMDCLDLESAADELRLIVAAVSAVDHASPDTYRRGEWCTHCPARTGCPAWVALVRWVCRDVAELQGEINQAVSMGAVQYAYTRLQEGKKALGMLEAEIRRIAYGTPLPLASGKYFAYSAGNERVADAAKVHEVLLRVATPEIAEVAVTTEVVASSSKKDIEKALKMLPVKQREPVWAALREAGALARKADVRECSAEDILSPPPMESR